MNGEGILNQVRIIINDPTYTRYDEINRAYREIGRICHHNWLRGESEDMLTFLDGQSEYWIDLSEIRVFTRLWVKGNDSGKQFWHPMDETQLLTFEDHALTNIRPDGTDRESRPRWYKIIESSNQLIKIQVTPVPDETYSAKIEFIKDLEEISRDTIPTMPHSYHDLIADMAAAKIMMMSDDPNKSQKAMMLEAKARNDIVNGLVRDAHANRLQTISRPRRSVNEFI